MKKNKNNQNNINSISGIDIFGVTTDVEGKDVMYENNMEYTSYVVKNRALPDIRDGLKPVQRRILIAMNKMNAVKFTKCADINGQTMQYHPHGDSYQVLVNMVHEDGELTPYIIGKGNFGLHTSKDLEASSMRYTEAKLSDISKDIFKELDKKTVNYIYNYNNTLRMPEFLPVKYPSILHYSQEGTVKCEACKFPSYNLRELNDAIIKYIDTGEKTRLIPDFATGGYIIDNNEIDKTLESGNGKLTLRANYIINKNSIIFPEIPYSTNIETIIEKCCILARTKLKDITSVNNLTGLDENGNETRGIEIECKKNTNMNILLEKLYKNTPLENSYACNMNLINLRGVPRVYGVWKTIDEWLIWRKECIKIGLDNQIKDLKYKNHLLNAVELIKDKRDELLNIIVKSKKNEVINNMSNTFEIDEEQSKYLRSNLSDILNEESFYDLISLLNKLKEKINEIEENKTKDTYLNCIIKDGLNYVSDNFGQERRTKLIELDETIKDTISQIQKEIEEYPVKLICTHDGYVKKMSTRVSADHKLKDGDFVVAEFDTNNISELVVFSDTSAYKIKLDDLSDSKPSILGDYLPNIIGLKNEILGYTIVDKDYKYTLILYDNGKIAKIDNKSYETSSYRKRLANSVCKGCNILQVLHLKNDCDITITNLKGKQFDYNTSEINSKMKRDTQGVMFKAKKGICKIEFKEVIEEVQKNIDVKDETLF